MNLRSGFLFFLAIALVGCSQPAKAPDAATTAPDGLPLPSEAQPKLPAVKVFIADREVLAEMAIDQESTRRGMMYRTSMGTNEGMIFAFPQPYRASFWMKNCPLPLSVAYIDPEGVIQEIRDLQPQDTNSVVARTDNIQFALEMNQGWFEKNGIKTGTLIRTEKGSLKDSFPQQPR